MAPRIERLERRDAVVVVIEDRSLPVVRLAVAMPGGARHDGPGRAGATRAALELMLRGTVTKTRTEFAYALEELGSSAYVVASHDVAVVGGAMLARHLDATAALLAEALREPAFRDDEIDRYVSEAVDDLRAARDDDRHLAELFLRRALYGGHAFARSPVGEISDLSTLSAGVVRDVHGALRKVARPVVLLAGDVDLARAERLAAELLPDHPGAVQPPRALPLPETQGLRFLVVDKPERSQVQLRLARLACDGTSSDALPFWLGTLAFGGTFTSPFTRAVRDERGWSYTAHAEFDRRRLHRAPFVLSSAPAASDAVSCVALELELYAALARGEIEMATIDFARSYLLNRWPFQVATASDLVAPLLQSELLGLPPSDVLALPNVLEALEAASVPPAMVRQLDPGAARVVMVASADSVVPELERRFPGAAVDVVSFKDGLFPEEEGR